MNQPAIPMQDYPQQAYRDNFARHLMGISLHLQSRIMERLRKDCGHPALRINFEPYFSMASEGGARLSDIADMLAISRQAANQTANQIEAAGYLRRGADSSDRRAKLLLLTTQGEKVIADGAREALRAETEIRGLVGSARMDATEESLMDLCREFDLLPAYRRGTGNQLALAAVAPGIAAYINTQLMEMTREKGHPDLKSNFGQVLTGIGPEGGRIQEIARAQSVSKQAISTIVGRLEELGYLQRSADPADARQQLLHFSAYGRQLISDAVASEAELRSQFAGVIGQERMSLLQETLSSLYRKLGLENELFSHSSSDIPTLARELLGRLGHEGARALAQQLINNSENNEEKA